MKRTIQLFLLFSCASMVASPCFSAKRISDFALLDQFGAFHQLSYYEAKPAVVVMAFADRLEPDIINAYQALAAQEANRSMAFYLFKLGGKPIDRGRLQKQLTDRGITLPVLMDDYGLVAEELALTRQGEVLVIDPKRKRINFRGPLGQALNTALREVVAAGSVSVEQASLSSLPKLPQSNREAGEAAISYADHVAPILMKHCVVCHRDGGVAPFAMDSWGVVLGWSPMIKEVLLSKRMPPGQVDPAIGNFRNGRVLSEQDLRTVIAWINAGGINNAERDPLREIQRSDEQWAFGDPDLILELPEQIVPATGLIDYTNLLLPIPLQDDVWLRASQFLAGDQRVLHHAEAFVVPGSALNDDDLTGSSTNKNSRTIATQQITKAYNDAINNSGDPDSAVVLPYVPGSAPITLPDNTGGKINRHSQLAIQLHYASIGRQVADNTRLGLWFYEPNQKPGEKMFSACVCIKPSQWQAIPAYKDNFIAKAEWTSDRTIMLHSIFPQMHYRGSAIRFEAYLPTGKVEPLLNVPKYNYNWQIEYQLAEPKRLPAGTKIVATAVYDNSNNNPFNPDASQEIQWGLESFNEVLMGILRWKPAD